MKQSCSLDYLSHLDYNNYKAVIVNKNNELTNDWKILSQKLILNNIAKAEYTDCSNTICSLRIETPGYYRVEFELQDLRASNI